MAVDNYINYRILNKTKTIEVIIDGIKKKVLLKEDDGGALYRKGREFSLDKKELDITYNLDPYDGVILSINENSDYPGYYYTSHQEFLYPERTRQMSARIPILKTYVRLDKWTKLSRENNSFTTIKDLNWAKSIEDKVINGNLKSLKDSSDVNRFYKEYNAGTYGTERYIK